MNIRDNDRGDVVPGRKRNNSGFTLVEVMVASIVLVIVSSGIMSGIIAALKVQANATDYYRATCLARNRIQLAWSRSWDEIPTIADSNFQFNAIDEETVCDTGEYMRTTFVTPTGTNCLNVTVQIWYRVKPQVWSPQPVTMETIISSNLLTSSEDRRAR